MHHQFSIQFIFQIFCSGFGGIGSEFYLIISRIYFFKIQIQHGVYQPVTSHSVNHQKHSHTGTDHTHQCTQLRSGNIPQIVLHGKRKIIPSGQFFKQAVLSFSRSCRSKSLRRLDLQNLPAAKPGRKCTCTHHKKQNQKIGQMEHRVQPRNNIPLCKDLHHQRTQPGNTQKQSKQCPGRRNDQTETDIMKHYLPAFHSQRIHGTDLRSLPFHHPTHRCRNHQNRNSDKNQYKNIGECLMLIQFTVQSGKPRNRIPFDHCSIILSQHSFQFFFMGKSAGVGGTNYHLRIRHGIAQSHHIT